MNKMVLFGGLAVLLLGGGGGGAYFFLLAPKAEKVEEKPKPPPTPVFVAIDQISVPLPRKDRAPRYYFVSMNLQTTEEGRIKLQSLMPKLRDAYLRELNSNPASRPERPDELDIEILKQRVLAITHQVAGADSASEALITRAVPGPN